MSSRRYRLATVGLVIAALGVVFVLFDEFGVTWDEPYHDIYGRHLIAYYASGFRDQGALSYHNLWLYGGAFDGPVALLKSLLPFGSYETAHLATAVVGIVGVVGAARTARLLAGARAGFAAAVALLIMPAWFGHMFFNPKDIPFATGMIWTLYYAMVFVSRLPALRWPVVAKLGVALGLTLGVRISGVFALVYLGLGLAAWLAFAAHRDGPRTAIRDAVRVGALGVLPALAIAYAIMVALWPWVQQDPLVRPVTALRIFADSPWNLDVLLDGRLVNSLALPALYLPIYFAVKLPELVLLLLFAAVVALVGVLRRVGVGTDWRRTGPVVLLTVAIAFPFTFFVVFRPVTYDSIRHFLFVLPPIAVAAALGLEAILARVAAGPPLLRHAVPASLVVYLVWHGSVMASLHPHEYVYYNRLVGGVRGAEDRFELDYWGNSYREAAERLAAFVATEPAGLRRPEPYRVLVCSAGTSAAYFFPPSLVLARDEFEADFYLASTRLDCDDEYDGDVIVRVTRDGAVLSVVKDRRRLRDTAPERLGARFSRPPPSRQHPGLDKPERGER